MRRSSVRSPRGASRLSRYAKLRIAVTDSTFIDAGSVDDQIEADVSRFASNIDRVGSHAKSMRGT